MEEIKIDSLFFPHFFLNKLVETVEKSTERFKKFYG